MNKQILRGSLIVAGAVLFSLASCNKKETASPTNQGAGDQEVITTVELHFTNEADTTQHFHAKWEDLDGDGPNAPTLDTIRAVAGVTYMVELELTDKSKTPAHDITHHIEEEAKEHMFHFTWTPAAGSSAELLNTILDNDGATPPLALGLKNRLRVGTSAGRGTYRVNLRHFGPGTTKVTDPTAGEADVDITFPVIVR